MTNGQARTPLPDLQAYTLDCITICQSELSAMATDRELQEFWIKLVETWAQTAERAARLLPVTLHDSASRRAGATPPPGPTPAVAAPDARDAIIERLANRVAELERRLATLRNDPAPS